MAAADEDSSDLRKYLHGALPDWRPSQLTMTERKLKTVGIATVTQFQRVLQEQGENSLNEQLRRKGEKEFSADALKALRRPAASPSTASPPEEEAAKGSTKAKLMERFEMARKKREAAAAEAAPAPIAAQEPVQQAGAVETEQDKPVQQDGELSLKERFLKAKLQKEQAAAAIAPGQLPLEKTRPAVQDEKTRAAAARRKREKAEEDLEIAEGELEDAVAANDLQVWTVKKAEVDRLRAQLDDFAEELTKEAASNTAVVTPAPVPVHVEDAEWFKVFFVKVFVKRSPTDQAKTWGWVSRGQCLQVLPDTIVDESGREWVELTLFELWRSCLCDPPLPYVENSGARGFCLVDGQSEALGLLLKPMRRLEAPSPNESQVNNFQRWCGVLPLEPGADSIATGSSGGEWQPARTQIDGKAARSYEVVHAGLKVHRDAFLQSPVLGHKARSDIVLCDTDAPGRRCGWLKLATEPGWVPMEMVKLIRTKAEEEKAKYEEDKIVLGGMQACGHSDPEIMKGMKLDVRASLHRVLQDVRGDDDLDSDEPSRLVARLDSCIARAKAYLLYQIPEVIEAAEQELRTLSREGEENRKRRLLRARVARATTEDDLTAAVTRADSLRFADVAEDARFALANLRESEAVERDSHNVLLERLSAATVLGDPVQIKAARDAAKAAGVPKRDMARVFALSKPA